MMMKSVKPLLLLLALSLWASVGPLPAQDRATGEGLVARAVTRMEARRYEEALTILSIVTKQDPALDAAWYYTGLCHLYQNQPQEARKALLKAVELDPKNYWYRDRLAAAYSLSGEDDLTVETYEKLLRDFPTKTEVYYSLANLYVRQGKLDKALQAMDQIETVFGRSEQITAFKYDLLLRQDKSGEALQVLLDHNREEASEQILSMLGDHEMAEYRDTAALRYYDQALALSPGYTPALLGQAEVWRSRRDWPMYFTLLDGFVENPDIPASSKSQYISALLRQSDGRFIQRFQSRLDSLLDNALAVHPADSSLLTTAGLYYHGTQRPEMAREAFRLCRDTYPQSLSAAATYIQFLSYQKDWEGVITESEAALEHFPEEDGFREMQNTGYYNTKQFRKVIENCERIIAAHPSDTSRTLPAWTTIGDIRHMLGDDRGAFKAYEKALQIHPDYIPVLNNYAYYLSLQRKKLSKAEAMSRKTIDKEPDNPTYLDTYAWILHLQGKDAEAKPFFKHAMLYGGKENAVILDHYAEVLYALGEYDLARMYWNQAVEKDTEGEIGDLKERMKKKLEATR